MGFGVDFRLQGAALVAVRKVRLQSLSAKSVRKQMLIKFLSDSP